MTTTTSRAPLPAPARRRRPFNPRRAGAAWALLVLAIAVSVLPVPLGAAHGTVHQRVAGRQRQPTCFPRTSTSAPSSGCSACRARRKPSPRAAPGPRSTSGSTCGTPSSSPPSPPPGHVFFSAMAAYAFARLRWKGRNAVFSLFLATMMVPPIFTALPNFLLIKNLGLLNTMLGTGPALRVHDARSPSSSCASSS